MNKKLRFLMCITAMSFVELPCLGLDASRYHHKTQEDDNDEDARARLLSEDEKYKLCSRLEIVCQAKNCGRKNIIDCPVRPGQVSKIIVDCPIHLANRQ